jgi:fumarate reductase flavoprotein subunit
MATANYFGHPGNRGDAVVWGRALGAATADLGAYQGHGSLAHPHGILITWALMMEGGIQVNAEGQRFSNEHDGYSEQARRVMAQPGGIAWDIYDARLHKLGEDFEDYRQAVAAGALRRGDTAAELASACGLPPAALAATLEASRRLAAGEGEDAFGRDFTAKPPLEPPFHAVKVTGALFHTQGGLVVDGQARVLREDGAALPNLFAAGGAARGVSGPDDWGYLSGNGLLTAVALGRIAGREAQARGD